MRRLAQRVIDFVESLEQAMPRKLIDGEAMDGAVRRRDRLRREIDDDFRAGIGACRTDQRGDRSGRQNDRQQAVLQRVGKKDIAEAWRDRDAKAVVIESPDRVFAR